MGWLLDELKKTDLRSAPKAVSAMMASDLRPREDDPIKDTSLANMVRLLDKGDASWWTSKGSAWVPALADVLGWEQEELKVQIQRVASPPRSGEPDPEQVVSDWFLRPLDLAEEDLFPGLPTALTRPRWALGDRVWWVAGTGAGRTLLGRWLSVRQGWGRREARTWSEALRDLPTRGKVYLELAAAEDGPTLADVVPEELRLCVAAPFLPLGPRPKPRADKPQVWFAGENLVGKESQPRAAPGWEVLTSPPLEVWRTALLAWVEARLRPGGGYVADEVHDLLEKLPLAELVETPGDLLDLLALIDESGVKPLFGDEDSVPLALVRAWIRRSVTRAGARLTSGVAALLRKSGDELIETLVMERLRQGLPGALKPSEWQALVPRRLSPPLDRERLAVLILERTDEAQRQALAMLRPGAEDIIAGLEAARVLVSDDGDRLTLRPAWLANAITQSAAEALLDEGPDGIGALLLYKQSSGWAMAWLLEQARAGAFDTIRQCIEGADAESPERLAALDGAFRALGIQAGLGDHLPLDLLTRAWETQMAFTSRRYVSYPHLPVVSIANESREDLTSRDAWLVAAFALSRHLVKEGARLRSNPLIPWLGLPTEKEVREGVVSALNSAMGLGLHRDSQRHPDVARAARSLARTVLDTFGLLPEFHILQLVLGPTLIVRRAMGRRAPELPAGDDLLRLNFRLAALDEACAAEGADVEDVLAWCWRQWRDRPREFPPHAWASRHQGDPAALRDAARLWRALPEDAISDSLLTMLVDVPGVWPLLSADLWRRWLRWRVDHQQAWHGDSGIWQAIPLVHVQYALRGGLLTPWDHDVRRSLWSRASEAMFEYVDELAAAPPVYTTRTLTQLVELLYHAPEDQNPALLRRARTWSRAPSDWPGVGAGLDFWLSHLVETRSSGWREAFSLLREISRLQVNAASQAPSAT